MQSISSNPLHLLYVCFYGSCNFSIEMNENTICTSIHGFKTTVHYLGAQSDIVDHLEHVTVLTSIKSCKQTW